ncbi:hypothetical protein [Alkalibacillus aidingensis]|uniref:hypothetical protein n=1 Tax=Alkalibacillus aidingensis TaxID=2747607 RepID=UPI001660FBD1|nr:hypothetical protein [Alkalibacillus aidingensis]
MGFFDEVNKNDSLHKELIGFENDLKKRYRKLNKAYEKLHRKPSYSIEKYKKVQQAVDEFTNYFERKGFNLSKSNIFVIASLRNRRAELVVTDSLELIIKVYNDESLISTNSLVLDDQHTDTPHFEGTIHNHDIQLFNKYRDLPLHEQYRTAMMDIQRDLEQVYQMIKNNHVPDFQFYDEENEVTYEHVVDLLENLNVELV